MNHLRKHYLLLLLLLSMSLTFFSTGRANFEFSDESLSETRLIAENNDGVTFEIEVPLGELTIESVSIETGGLKEYLGVSLPGWAVTSQPGSPSLPMITRKIGVPHGSKVSLQVVPGKTQKLVLDMPVLPAVTQEPTWESSFTASGAPTLPNVTYVFEEDPAIYHSSQNYPGKLAELTNDGMVRGQRVVGIAIYPLQFNPATNELTLYESVLVKVTFEGAQRTQPASDTLESQVYESFFKDELLNYDTARSWRQGNTNLIVENSTEISPQALPWTPPNPGWKVKVRNDGIYQLTYAELDAAGVPVDDELDPSTLQLFNLGEEVAIHVVDGGDSSFDPGDYLLFYGQESGLKYALDNVYWLTFGYAPGLRMNVRDGTPGSGETPEYYAAHQHRETNALYIPGIPGEEEFERWMWDYARAATTLPRVFSKEFVLAAPYDGGATLTIAMLAFNHDPTIDPDHHVTVSLNGTQVGEYQWDGINWLYPEISIPQGLLTDGSNTLTVTAFNPPGVDANTVYIDWFELDLASYFHSEGNRLAFTYNNSGDWKYQIDGFTSEKISAFDLNNPFSPVIIEGLTTVPSGLDYAAQFQDTVTAGSNYLVIEDSAIADVQSVTLDIPSNLQSTTNGADYIVITHQAFNEPANNLRDFRAAQGLRAIVVDVEDIYDEFAYGLTGVKPIRDFLLYTTTNWVDPDPTFVVLFGDGHFDPKNYGGYGRTNYIPPYLAPVDPTLIETAADNRYVMLTEGDAFPDMMLGRLAVNNSVEAAAIVDKIIDYEESPYAGDWWQQVLLVADNADAAGNFPLISDNLVNCCLPEPYQTEKVYYGITHSNTTNPSAGEAILAGINAGKLIVNYIGHGQVTRWGTSTEDMFDAGDVAGLNNNGKLPIMLPMTCMDGYYIYNFSSLESLAEVITKADGKGAIASWSATGYGTSAGHDFLNRGFFKTIFLSGEARITLGEATNAGKLNLWASGSNQDLLDTYLLFGDPALTIAIPNYKNFMPLIIK